MNICIVYSARIDLSSGGVESVCRSLVCELHKKYKVNFCYVYTDGESSDSDSTLLKLPNQIDSENWNYTERITRDFLQRNNIDIIWYHEQHNSCLRKLVFYRTSRLSSFVYLMEKSSIVLTDSGGIQEEAPSLGKPVLVMRDTTERPEAVEAGTVKLVGADFTNIVDGVSTLLENPELYSRMSKSHNPYGDGKACERICRHLVSMQ